MLKITGQEEGNIFSLKDILLEKEYSVIIFDGTKDGFECTYCLEVFYNIEIGYQVFIFNGSSLRQYTGIMTNDRDELLKRIKEKVISLGFKEGSLKNGANTTTIK